MAKKDEIEEKELIKFIKAIEKEKLYYFCLAYKNSSEVVIVKSPLKKKEEKGNQEIKKFLGYFWSGAKGKEGIQYIGKTIFKSDDDSEFDEDDVRILNNLANLSNINTPLYNPQYSDDVNKIIKSSISWDVMGGIARRAWARNPAALQVSEQYNNSRENLHITIPQIPEQKLIDNLVEKYF